MAMRLSKGSGWRTRSKCCKVSYWERAWRITAATRSADGKNGFSEPFVNVRLSGSMGWQSETMQMVTATFGSPVEQRVAR